MSLVGKVGRDAEDGTWVFFDEGEGAVGPYDTEKEALEASHRYHTELAQSVVDDWDLGPACGLEPDICESCQ